METLLIIVLAVSVGFLLYELVPIHRLRARRKKEREDKPDMFHGIRVTLEAHQRIMNKINRRLEKNETEKTGKGLSK